MRCVLKVRDPMRMLSDRRSEIGRTGCARVSKTANAPGCGST
jgi:hypothetical protein